MSQFARAAIDITITGWTDELDVATNLYQKISEAIRNDSEYLRTGLAPANAIYAAKLTSVIDPASSAGHIVRYAFRKNADAGDAQDLTVQLRQGYVSEGTPGTLIKAVTHTVIAGDAWTAGSVTLSGAEADAITDYTNLYVRVLAP